MLTLVLQRNSFCRVGFYVWQTSLSFKEVFALCYFVSNFYYQQNTQSIFQLLFKKKIPLSLKFPPAESFLPFPLQTQSLGMYSAEGQVASSLTVCFIAVCFGMQRGMFPAQAWRYCPSACGGSRSQAHPVTSTCVHGYGYAGNQDSPLPPALAHLFRQ